MRTANPALNNNTFSQTGYVYQTDDKMSIQGTVNKTTVLLFITMLAAAFTWYLTQIDSSTTKVLMGLGFILGLIMAFITCFKPAWSPTTAPIYCLFEGLFLGGFSAFINAAYPGIPLLAVSLTFGILFSLLMAYKSGWIQATENFKLGVVAATGGIFLVYLVSFILSFFGGGIPFIHSSGL
ncbi:MAG: Bax inhibitor-1/YccA family protein, partial [Candidatus Poribacteria bacterium]|nr:Bax inhibitor-1/YccA family protein [Candidatus Poribacteria bacterium]